MNTEPGFVVQIGAACFGIAIGFITYRTLIRTVDRTAIADLAAVIAAVGGGAVTVLFAPGSILFGWYAIGLLAGMGLFFGLYGLLNGKQKLATVMSGGTTVLTHDDGRQQPGNLDRPQA